MRVLVIGGGQVGSFLSSELLKAGHGVTVVESDGASARRVAEDTGALVLHGDGTDVSLLRGGDVDKADWVLAVTGLDEQNLVACQLASTLGAKRVLARLNNPANRPTFAALGIPVVAVTDMIARVISQQVEVDVEEAVRHALLGRGHVSLVEIEIPEGTPPKPVIEFPFPQPSILVTVVRGDAVIVPGARTAIQGGDRVLAVTAIENESELRRVLCER